MLRVVLDSVIFVRALINPFSRSGRILFEHAADYRLVLSSPVTQEILEVLHRPELRQKFRSLQGLDFRRVLQLMSHAELVEVEQVPAVSRDPRDDKFLATARAGQAEYLVSEDRDLLDLVSYEGIPIVDTETFLSILERE